MWLWRKRWVSIPLLGGVAIAVVLAMPGQLAWANKGQQGGQGKPAAKRIQPKDGFWRWDMGTTHSSATCLPGLVQSLQSLLPQERGEHVRFAAPFHPAHLVAHQDVRWEQRGPNHFVAKADGLRLQGFALPLRAHYELQVLSPTRMQGKGQVHIEALQPCTVSAPFEFQRQSE